MPGSTPSTDDKQVHLWDDAKEDDDCAAEPAGTILVRDEVGYWYELVFDGSCDGCGSVQWEGETLGEACIDVSPLYAWEDAPW
ncbi:MAG: hypothetical protein GY884_09285 [Proteobacteria bacterium]|nr:hypothetical protein [Pseudomonadota bacterium]